MKICIIEDEELLAKALSKGLKNAGYESESFFDGEEGVKVLETRPQDFALAIIDLMLPNKSGLEICRNLRQNKITLPILVLSARDTVADKATLLREGADDYITKPFSFEELVARVQAILRRPRAYMMLELRAGDLILETNNFKALYKNNEIPLSIKEFNLLEYFIRHPEQTVTREELFENLWGLDLSSNVIEAHIKNLRKKIEKYTKKDILDTVWGVGYRLGSKFK